MRPLWLVLGFLVCGQAFAQTACPTRSDLQQGGIRLSQTDPRIVADYSIAEDGTLVAERTNYASDGGAESIELLSYLHPFLPPERRMPTYHTTLLSSADVTALTRLPEVTVWDTMLSVSTEPTPGSEPEFEPFSEIGISVRYHEDSVVTLGECQYDAWKVFVTTSFDDGRRSVIQYRYVPDLGLPISAELLSDRFLWSHVVRTFFWFEAIEAL